MKPLRKRPHYRHAAGVCPRCWGPDTATFVRRSGAARRRGAGPILILTPHRCLHGTVCAPHGPICSICWDRVTAVDERPRRALLRAMRGMYPVTGYAAMPYEDSEDE